MPSDEGVGIRLSLSVSRNHLSRVCERAILNARWSMILTLENI